MANLDESLNSKQIKILGNKQNLNQLSTLDLISNNYERDFHTHDEAQLLLVVRGLVTFDINNSRWLVPPRHAIWIPPLTHHSMSSVGEVDLHCIYFDPEKAHIKLNECCILSVDPLLRELIVKMATLPTHIQAKDVHTRLVQTMLDQISIAPQGKMQLPLPVSPNLRFIAESIINNPSERLTIPEWAKRSGMSERTLQRTIMNETGMSFGHWRRQIHLLLALKQLAERKSVHSIAYSLGYETPSAFIDMFRKILGCSPLKFINESESHLTA
ncbi:helix-turn-helix domain-containing protein [Shewanella vesiculosa]|uniref:helix-turn-helix domain-containing protein n=1 Tax=Shewanella vesiculosa TaxID=518738 RepID=UPI00384C22B4